MGYPQNVTVLGGALWPPSSFIVSDFEFDKFFPKSPKKKL